jgi:hypothetical protein
MEEPVVWKSQGIEPRRAGNEKSYDAPANSAEATTVEIIPRGQGVYKAFVKELPRYWAEGSSPQGALGLLHQVYPWTESLKTETNQECDLRRTKVYMPKVNGCRCPTCKKPHVAGKGSPRKAGGQICVCENCGNKHTS